jgi:hypothetical protein
VSGYFDVSMFAFVRPIENQEPDLESSAGWLKFQRHKMATQQVTNF